MRCEIEALEERVGKQEQYSSKDTIIIDNIPLYDVNLPLLANVLKFFECFLDYRQQIADIKKPVIYSQNLKNNPCRQWLSILYISTTR